MVVQMSFSLVLSFTSYACWTLLCIVERCCVVCVFSLHYINWYFHTCRFRQYTELYCHPAQFSFSDLSSKYARRLESEPELSDLMNEVASKVPAKWRQISVQLGLTPSDQDCFMALSPNDPLQCFTSVFRVWKNRATKLYKWSTVIQALESPAVDEMRLAEELRTKLQS